MSTLRSVLAGAAAHGSAQETTIPAQDARA